MNIIGKEVRLIMSATIGTPGATLWATVGDTVTVVGQHRDNCDFDDVRRMIFMVAYKCDSYDAPYHFPVRGSHLDLSDFTNES